MNDSKKAPAILLFKNMRPAISKLTDADRLSLFDAILQYADDDTIPEMNYVVEITFEFVKRSIDTNEEKYQKKLEDSRQRYEERKRREQEQSKNKPTDEIGGEERDPTGKDKPPGEVEQGRITEIQARFLNAFKERCPNQAINCKISDFPDVDLAALMFAIQKSPQYLMNAEKNQNLGGLRWYLENATKIIAGKYEKFAEVDVVKSRSSQSYTTEELEQLSKPKE